MTCMLMNFRAENENKNIIDELMTKAQEEYSMRLLV